MAEPLAQLLHRLVEDALGRGATALHLDANHETARVRARIEGELEVLARPSSASLGPLLDWLRTQARPPHPRLPGEGLLELPGGRSADLLFIEGLVGRSAVLRFHPDRPYRVRTLSELGAPEVIVAQLEEALRSPRGRLIVWTGPRRSGRNTMACASLLALDRQARSVASIEIAPRAPLPDVTQWVVDERIGLTTASWLYFAAQADVDALYVRALIDRETSELALRHALQGRLVLTTLHTVGALGVPFRLEHMGLSRAVIADALGLLHEQRLLCRLCPACRAPDPATGGWRAAGCAECGGSGTRGRVLAIGQVRWGEALRSAWLAGGDEAALREAARAQGGHTSARSHALALVKAGETTRAEVDLALPTME